MSIAVLVSGSLLEASVGNWRAAFPPDVDFMFHEHYDPPDLAGFEQLPKWRVRVCWLGGARF